MEGRLTRMPHVNELHEQHDQILVVSFASGDLAPDDRDRAVAQSLVNSCAECAALHDDVLAIARATEPSHPPSGPATSRSAPSRPPSSSRAAGAGSSPAFAAPGSIFSKQLGVGMATLGIVGLLIGAAPSISLVVSADPPPRLPLRRCRRPQPGTARRRGARAALKRARGVLRGGIGAPGRVCAGGPRPRASLSPTRWRPSRPGTSPTPDRRRRPSTASPPVANSDADGGDGPVRHPGSRHRHRSPAAGNGPSGLVIASSILLAAGLLVLLLRSIGRRAAAG